MSNNCENWSFNQLSSDLSYQVFNLIKTQPGQVHSVHSEIYLHTKSRTGKEKGQGIRRTILYKPKQSTFQGIYSIDLSNALFTWKEGDPCRRDTLLERSPFSIDIPCSIYMTLGDHRRRVTLSPCYGYPSSRDNFWPCKRLR